MPLAVLLKAESCRASVLCEGSWDVSFPPALGDQERYLTLMHSVAQQKRSALLADTLHLK